MIEETGNVEKIKQMIRLEEFWKQIEQGKG
jgi:hypothetical protein